MRVCNQLFDGGAQPRRQHSQPGEIHITDVLLSKILQRPTSEDSHNMHLFKKKHFWQRSSKNWPLRPLTFSPKHISSKDWPIRGNQQLGGEILQPQVSPGLLLNSSGWKAKQLGNDLKDKSDPIEYCGPCCEFFSGLFRRPYYDPYIIIDWFYWKLTGLVLVGWLAGWLVGMILAVLLGKKWFSLLWINPNISEKYFGKERI